MRITIARRGSALWDACGDLARTRYARDYQARIEPSPDCYISLTPDGASESTPVACAGLTYGGLRPLLVENYFGASAADTLAARAGTVCEPTALVEIGPLASVEAGAGLALVRMLPAFCWCNGAEFIMCTITRQLAALLARIGIRFTPVTQAREDQLPLEQRGRWGTYYDTDPMAGYVDVRHFGAEISQRTELGYHLAVTWDRPAALAEAAGAR